LRLTVSALQIPKCESKADWARESIDNCKRDRRSRHGESMWSGDEPMKENPCSGRRRHERVEIVPQGYGRGRVVNQEHN
jgi:hypothetical protein